MSRMAKIFWNEIIAIILSYGFFNFFLIYLVFSKQEACILSSSLIISLSCLIAFIVARKDIKRINIIYVGVYAIGGLTLLLSGLRENGIGGDLFYHFILALNVLFISFLSYGEKRMFEAGIRVLIILFTEYALISAMLFFSNPLKIGIIGIAIMAAIAFFPSGSGGDIKLDARNNNGLAG